VKGLAVMARPIGNHLPPELVRALDGTDLGDKIGLAYPLITVDDSGAPRLSMLSAGELLARDDSSVRIALWPGTRTGKNLARADEVLLCCIIAGSVLYVRGRSRRLVTAHDAGVQCFEVAVTAVETDAHEGMPVTSGITFAPVDPAPEVVLASWEDQLAALAKAHD
jgi:hypothetical protein